MRKSFDALTALVVQQLGRDVMSGDSQSHASPSAWRRGTSRRRGCVREMGPRDRVLSWV
jgi:hypothetical protein